MTRQFWLGFEAGAVATLCVTIMLTVAWIISRLHNVQLQSLQLVCVRVVHLGALQRLSLLLRGCGASTLYRIAALALHDLQGRIADEGHRKAMTALRAIQDLTEE